MITIPCRMGRNDDYDYPSPVDWGGTMITNIHPQRNGGFIIGSRYI